MTEALTIGPIQSLVQNTVYASPGRGCQVFSNVALEISNTSDFAVKQSVTAATPTEVVGAFIRSTTGTATVRLVTYP